MTKTRQVKKQLLRIARLILNPKPRVIRNIFNLLYVVTGFTPENRGIMDKKFVYNMTFEPAMNRERQRQNKLHPDNTKLSRDDWKLLILEEYGEMVQAFNDNDFDRMQAEGVQLAALIQRYHEEYV